MKSVCTFLMTGLLIFTACEDQPTAPAPEDRIVVSALLTAGTPITRIQVTHCYPISGSPVAKYPAVSDARVSLRVNEDEIHLDLVDADSGYYAVADPHLHFHPDDSLFLHIARGTLSLTAATKVPEGVSSELALPDTICIDTRSDLHNLAFHLPFASENYLLRMENSDDQAQALWDNEPPNYASMNGGYSSGPNHNVLKGQLVLTGRHRLILTQLSNSCALRASSSLYDKDKLYALVGSNIHGGLGYLTAAVSDTLSFYVKKIR